MDRIWEVAGTCGACGHGDWRPVFAIRGRRFGQCPHCAVVRLVDRVAPAHLGLVYDGYYPAELPAGRQLERDLANPTFAWRQRRLERAMDRRLRREGGPFAWLIRWRSFASPFERCVLVRESLVLTTRRPVAQAFRPASPARPAALKG
jgi:hypothetical protein